METVIDWSKAPEWATELALNPYEEQAWLGDDGYSYLMGNGGVVSWSFETAYDRTAFKIMQIRPRQSVWTGKGLPPVGTVCEWRDDEAGCWQVVEIMYLSGVTALLRFPDDPGACEGAYSPSNCQFRPIRTPEQIAADVRQKEINELAEHIAAWSCNAPPLPRHIHLAEHIYENHYRKQVAP